MKPGDEFECPHCGKSTFLKKDSIMDGWTKVGDALFCAACSEKIEDLTVTPKSKTEKKTEAKSALANLLGAEEEEKPVIAASDDEKQFCRDCKHFISHPFMDRCSLHEKDVNPMDDCPDFERKEKKKKSPLD